MANRPRIAVVGSVNVDLTTFTDDFPRPGETIFGKRFDLGFGGKGANQAVAARLCGAEASMVAKVGNDLLGRRASRISNRLVSTALTCARKLAFRAVLHRSLWTRLARTVSLWSKGPTMLSSRPMSTKLHPY